MMAGNRGASLRLLYQMKMATERLLLSSDSGATGAPQNGSTAASAGGGVTKGIRIPRQAFDNHEQHFFEHRLRATCPNVKQARLDKVGRKFEEERQKQEVVSSEMARFEQARIAEQRDIHRFSLRERMRQNKAAKDEWNQRSNELWEENMMVRRAREDRGMEADNKVMGKHMEKTTGRQRAAGMDVMQGIEVCERNLTNLGLRKVEERRVADNDSSSDSDRSENRADRLLPTTTQAANARDLVESFQKRMPSSKELEQEAGLFLRKIKESKNAGSIARQERERRRRRVLVEQQHEQDLLEESKLEEVLLETLSRESAEEKRISYSVWRTNKYEDVIVKNRDLRQAEYTKRRKSDEKEALRRDRDLLDEMLETMREQEKRECGRYRAHERDRRSRHLAQLSEEAEGVLELVKAMAFAALQQEQLTDKKEVDETLWREWTQLFIENVPAVASQPLQQSVASLYPLTALPTEVKPIVDEEGEADPEERARICMYEAALQDYVESKGQWEAKHADEDQSDAAGSVGGSSPLLEEPPAAAPTSGKPSRRPSAAPSAAPSPTPPPPGPAPPYDPVEDMKRMLEEECASFSFADRLSQDVDIVDGRPVNYRLGSIVASLLDRTYAQPALPEPPPMPDVPLRLVISGKPFAGKRTVANRLAEAYGLQVIDLDELTRECFLLSGRPDIPNHGPIDVLSFTTDEADKECSRLLESGNPYVKQLQEIGRELRKSLANGKAIDNEMYVFMITTKIRALFPDRLPKTDGSAASTDGDVSVAGSTGAPVGDDLEGSPVAADGEDGSGSEGDEGSGSDEGLEDPCAEDGGGGEGDAAVAPKAAATLEEGAVSKLEPAGWILVGFPEDKSQLELLERFLCGWVHQESRPTPVAEVKKAKAALLAPRPPEVPPALEAVPGGYDLHIRLEVPGEECVRRAFGRRVDPANSLQYHLEDSRPVAENQIIYERLVPVDDLTNSLGSLTTRIHGFQVAQAELDPLLAYFGPFPEVERLVRIDANLPAEVVYDSLEEQVAMLLERKQAQRAKDIEDAAEAKRAAKAAEEAAKEAARKEIEAADAEAAEAAARAAAAAAEAAEDPKAKGKGGKEDKSKKGPAPVPTTEAPAKDAEPEAPVEIPPPLALAELPKFTEKLEDNLFNLLLREWQEMQSNFCNTACQLFSWHRSLLADIRSGLHGIQQRFISYVERGDDKQVLVDQFVYRFNLFSEEYPTMRKQDQTKDELHQQVDDLLAKLREKVEMRRDECETQLREIEDSGYVEAQAEVLAAQVQNAVQMEARRYHAACQLLSDYYWGCLGTGLPPARDPPPAIDVLSDKVEEAPPEDPKAKKAPPKAKKGAAEDEPPPLDPMKARAEKLRRRAPAPFPGAPQGNWEFPFLHELMKKANALVWKPVEFGAPMEAEEPESVEPAAKAKAKAKGRASPAPGKGGKEDAPTVPSGPAPAVFVDLQQALLSERLTYAHRLYVIQNWAERRLLAMSEEFEETYLRLHDWVLLRRHKELDAVVALADELKEHIESEALITSRLTLEGAHLHRHPNVLLKAPTPPVIPPPMESVVPHRWSIDQLENMLSVVHTAAKSIRPGGRILPTQTLVALMQRMTQATAGEDGAREQPQVPYCWRPCDIERLQNLSNLFDHAPRTATVDCVEFLLHLGLMHNPLGWPSFEALLLLRTEIEAMMPDNVSWPDFWITQEQFETLSLFEDVNGGEAELAQKFKPQTAIPPSAFNRGAAQRRWLGRVLRCFPAPLRRQQAWALEMAWYKYAVRWTEETERNQEMLDDVKSISSASPHQPHLGDQSMAALAPGLVDMGLTQDTDTRDGRGPSVTAMPPPPLPGTPTGLPEPPGGDGAAVSVRQLLTYLCQGTSPEDGLARALAVLGPSADRDQAVSAEDFHALLLQHGARPTPASMEGDGRPRHPSVARFCEELGIAAGYTEISTTSFFSNPRSSRLLTRLGLRRRHCRAPIEKLFPPGLKPGARLDREVR
eukprot:TRINITY_DN43201_c0_g1_i1.p1 TRINITY_DN43201_c0_g1~~TRINITY_DN43201_c0_g1_i1.p1  ORF type:complete len:2107 (-),score=524.56 TRINITY_DN43201_c0_g1_i1:44-5974(-)